MSRLFFVCLVGLAAGVLLLADPTMTSATRIVPMNSRQLAEGSSAVVRGSVTGVHSFWNADRSKIFTETTLAVEETYKGSPGREVRLLQLGGTVDGVKVTVHGALLWTQGEEVVVFLEPYQNDHYHVVGFSQGKFKVERDPNTGRAFVRRPVLADVELVSEDGGPQSGGGTAARIPLDQFLTEALGSGFQSNQH